MIGKFIETGKTNAQPTPSGVANLNPILQSPPKKGSTGLEKQRAVRKPYIVKKRSTGRRCINDSYHKMARHCVM